MILALALSLAAQGLPDPSPRSTRSSRSSPARNVGEQGRAIALHRPAVKLAPSSRPSSNGAARTRRPSWCAA